jgi:hypothetical protein
MLLLLLSFICGDVLAHSVTVPGVLFSHSVERKGLFFCPFFSAGNSGTEGVEARERGGEFGRETSVVRLLGW